MENKSYLFYQANQLIPKLTDLKTGDALTSRLCAGGDSLNLDVLYKDTNALIINLFEYCIFDHKTRHQDNEVNMLKNVLLCTLIASLFAPNVLADNSTYKINFSVNNVNDKYHLFATQNAGFASGNYHEIDSKQSFVFSGKNVNQLVVNYYVINPKNGQYTGLTIPIGVHDDGFGVSCIGNVYHVDSVKLDVSCQISVLSGTKIYYVDYTIVSKSK